MGYVGYTINQPIIILLIRCCPSFLLGEVVKDPMTYCADSFMNNTYLLF